MKRFFAKKRMINPLFGLSGNMPASYRKSGGGFTLIELVIVIALIGILASIAAPSIATWRSNLNLNKDARDLVNAIKIARTQAVNLNKSVTFTMVAGSGYSVVDQDGITLLSGTTYRDSNIIDIDLGLSVQFNTKGFPSTSGSFELNNGTTKKTVTVYITGGTKIL